ncbi:MAG TPA: DUF2834 domain-containing protein [Microbacteriaceae bacterium]|nr:DUF2834 domain-containing protein [Microbacteriaceae bacterium]
MNGSARARFWVYLVLAGFGFVTAMVFNGLAVMTGADYGTALTASPANWVFTFDLGTVAVAAAIFIIVEGRRIGMRRAWLLVPLSGVTAIAFVFPLFLALRERHLSGLSEVPKTPA